MPPELIDVREFALRYTAAWCSQIPESVAAFFSQDGSLCVNDGPAAVGRQAIAEVARSFMTAFPDLRVGMDDLRLESGEPVYHWSLSGTNTGPAGTNTGPAGTNAGPGGSGNKVCISGFERWRMGSDGLIASSQGHFDATEYGRQLEQAP